MTKTFEHLLDQFLQDTLSPEDLQLFMVAVKQPENAEALEGKLFQKLEAKAFSGIADTRDMETKFREMLEKADRISNSETKIIELNPEKKFFNIRRIAVAASIILALGFGSYFFFFNKNQSQGDEPLAVLPGDVKAPVTNRAMITLANGQQVYLDSVSNGQLAVQGNVKLVKLANGQIAYQTSDGSVIPTQEGTLQYNTLSNPRGSKVIDMTLADGSQAWLNAGSSITYPVAFVGNERKVFITGEAYFEVAHNTAMPFKVSKGAMEVTVLGTHFNMNAYDDETDIKVTLLEGSVKVSDDKSSLLIKPKQQAVVTKSGTLSLRKNVDIEEIMAWKNGQFIFNSMDLESIMRQVSKWYDTDVVFEGKANKETFSGVVSRNSNISQVLKIIEEGGVKCKIEGKKLRVLD